MIFVSGSSGSIGDGGPSSTKDSSTLKSLFKSMSCTGMRGAQVDIGERGCRLGFGTVFDGVGGSTEDDELCIGVPLTSVIGIFSSSQPRLIARMIHSTMKALFSVAVVSDMPRSSKSRTT